MDYYFQEELRWTFGFDNPNKAAALIASLLPWLWVFQVWSCRLKCFKSKQVCRAVGLVALCFGWWLLFKTLSRGGIVASFVAFAYLAICNGRSLQKHFGSILVGAIVICGLFFSTRAADRSVSWVGKREGAVENRLLVWKGGLEMLAGSPKGVGRGQSGEFYMEWYQPIDMKARYRTLVNSYLTFAVERGLWIFGLVTLIVILFWKVTQIPISDGHVLTIGAGFRASLIAFAVAGFFTTTMEDPGLWLVPLVDGLFLAAFAWRFHKEWAIALRLQQSLAIVLLLCGIAWTTGSILANNEPITLAFFRNESKLQSVTICQKTNRDQARQLTVLLDPEVIGEDYGKLMRRLATASTKPLFISLNQLCPEAQDVFALGDAVKSLSGIKASNICLVAPGKIAEAQAAEILKYAKSVKILFPSFDEDGRVAFWLGLIASAQRPHSIRTVFLDQVGTRVDWAWDQVMAQSEIENRAVERNRSMTVPPLPSSGLFGGAKRLVEILA